MRLAIICGHEEKAKGAYSPILKAWEYDYNKELAIDICREASEKGIESKVFFRNGLGIEKVGQAVNEFGGLAVELHFNSAAKRVYERDAVGGMVFDEKGNAKFKDVPDEIPNGIETLYDVDPSESKLWAQTVHNALIKALTEPNPNYNEYRKDQNPFRKPKDRGLKLIADGDRGHRNLKAVKIPSCLIEPFFAHNKLDAERFQRNRMKCVRAIVDAVIAYHMLTAKM